MHGNYWHKMTKLERELFKAQLVAIRKAVSELSKLLNRVGGSRG